MFVVLLYVMMSPTLSAPVPEHQCTTLNNGQVRCDLPSSIIPEVSDPTCHIDWNIDNTPVVKYANGKLDYKYPVITATMESVTVDGCNGSLVCDFSCPKTDVTKSLLFSCKFFKAEHFQSQNVVECETTVDAVDFRV
ncbi:hypothetical protein AMELA_G00082890 [Ameiurus melas]|uniref:Uncharacterized protein n=1 Tax=Ameiurus melas TaxID=219545 RepID=A0A7J6B449_AMEME|nr:hypothetical protein AMELA_G00082890 [Ameiurus melas]